MDTPERAPAAEPQAAGGVGPARLIRTRPPLVAIVAATAAALAAWLLGESGLFRVDPAIVPISMMGTAGLGATNETRAIAEARTAALVYSASGALLGLAMGWAGGWSRGRTRSLVGVAVGLVAGGLAGGLAPLGVVPAYTRLAGDLAGELLPSALLHAALWAPIGATAGLALGLGRGGGSRLGRSILGGLLGAVAGAFAYEFLGGMAMPTGGTGEPVPATWAARLLASILLALPVAAGAAILGDGGEASRTPPPGPRAGAGPSPSSSR